MRKRWYDDERPAYDHDAHLSVNPATKKRPMRKRFGATGKSRASVKVTFYAGGKRARKRVFVKG
jgi:hypothetical protein